MANQEIMFDYFYSSEAEQFAFYRIPKILFTDDFFRELSSDAKVLYGLMLDRMALSVKNQWIDEENRAYIIFTLEQVMEFMNCGKEKGVKILAELDTAKGIGLIERVKQGQGKPTLIYVKNFTVRETTELPDGEEAVSQTSEKPKSRLPKNRSQDFRKTEVKTSEKPKSRLPKSRSQDFRKADPNKTDYSDTENNYNNISISPSILPSVPPETDVLKLPDIPGEPEELVCLVGSVYMDVLTSMDPEISIGGRRLPADQVKSVYRSLQEKHFRQVVEYIKNNPVSNLNAVKTALYNSPKYAVLETHRGPTGKERRKNRFGDFPQRNYDYENLEKKLLGVKGVRDEKG